MPIYTVRPGDTMSGIAADHGVSLQELIRANPQVSNPNLIFVGQSIDIPYGATVTPTLPGGFPGGGGASFDDLPPRPPSTINPRAPIDAVNEVINPPRTGGTPTSSSGGSTPPAGNVQLPPTTPTPMAGQGGYITFSVQRPDGSFAPVTLFFPANVWAALINSPMNARYGLSQPGADGSVPIAPGQIDNFRRDLANVLPPNLLTTAEEVMASLEAVAGAGEEEELQYPPLDPRMVAEGIAWGRNPITGEIELIDTKPLEGPGLSAWEFQLIDPNDPTRGQWVMVADPSDLNNMYEGVPSSVRPWVQRALDAGGDVSVVPPGPAREWVEFALGQAAGSSRRPPSELPFGVGLPQFEGGRPGASIAAPGGPGQVVTIGGGPVTGPLPVFPGQMPPREGGATFTPPTAQLTAEQIDRLIPASVTGDVRGIAGQSIAQSYTDAINQTYQDLASQHIDPETANLIASIFTPEVMAQFAAGQMNNGLPLVPNLAGLAELTQTILRGGSVGTDPANIGGNTASGFLYGALQDQGLVGFTPRGGSIQVRGVEPQEPDDNIPGVVAPPPPPTQQPPVQTAPSFDLDAFLRDNPNIGFSMPTPRPPQPVSAPQATTFQFPESGTVSLADINKQFKTNPTGGLQAVQEAQRRGLQVVA